jgi:hypothetical protein
MDAYAVGLDNLSAVFDRAAPRPRGSSFAASARPTKAPNFTPLNSIRLV